MHDPPRDEQRSAGGGDHDQHRHRDRAHPRHYPPMSSANFEVPADAYDRFMGRYSQHLSAQLADLAGIERGQRVLDVGAGTGALTGVLVERLGPEAVTAVDPSESFINALRARQPGVRVELAAAEKL